MRSLIVLVMAATTTAVGCNMASDQDGRTGSGLLIGSDVSCPSCSIVFDSVATLEGAYFSGPTTTIARGPTGTFYLVDAGDALLKAYGSDGRSVRQIGRRGGGPGEYEMVRNVLVSDDGSVLVLDGRLGRLSAFSEHGEFLRSTQVPVFAGAAMPAVLLSDGALVVNARPVTVGDAGHALNVIDQNGNVSLSFDGTSADPRRRWVQRRLLWARSNGELLVARPYTFTIDVYARDYTKESSITRVAEWVPSEQPDQQPSDGVFDRPFTPALMEIWEDERGLLWLYMMLPSPLWEPGPPMQEVMSEQGIDEEAYRALGSRPRVETIIEVVDLNAGHLLTRMRLDNPVGAPFGGGYFARSVEDSSLGEPSLQISRVQLKR